MTLQRTAVVVRERYLLEGYAFQAPNVDGGHAVTFSIRAFAVRVNSTHRTETVFDSVLVEKIGARILFRRKQAQFLTWHEPHQSTLTLTNTAIAGHRPVQCPLDLECDSSAVTIAFVVHGLTPTVY